MSEVKRLIAAKADVNYRDENESTIDMQALHWALDCEQAEMVKGLLAAGAEPNAYEGRGGGSALIRASNQGSLEVVTLLLAANASIDHRTEAGHSLYSLLV